MIERSSDSWVPHVAIIGAYPPPVGGNSVHIARLYELLKGKGYRVQVLDYLGSPSSDDPEGVSRLSGRVWSKAWQVLSFMRGIPHDTILHVHTSAFGRFRWFAPVLLLASLRHKRVITIHSGSFAVEQRTPIHKLYLRMLLSQFDRIVAVSREIRDYVLSLGISSERVCVIPAFIREDAQYQFLPESFELIPQDKVRIVTSGYLTRLYNYEVLADAMQQLDHKKYHFIFAFYGTYDEQYETELMGLLRGHSNFTIFRDLSPEAFLAILASSDVYVRPTQRDGDSVAVREALALGNRVYASDCVRRPSGCILFKDTQELIHHLRVGSADQDSERPQAADGSRQLLELYAALSGNSE